MKFRFGTKPVLLIILIGLILSTIQGHASTSVSTDSLTVIMTQASVISVPGDYALIQEAVDAAQPGDVILIQAGTYTEAVVVDKALTLQGQSAEKVIIDGLNVNIPLTISGTGGVTVKHISLINGYHYGIKISENADGNTLSDCIIDTVGGPDSSALSGDPSFGVWMEESDNNQLSRLEICNIRGRNYRGNYGTATGIHAVNTKNTLIQDCDIHTLFGGIVRGLYLFNDFDNTYPSCGIRIEGGSISDLRADWALYDIGVYGISCEQTNDLLISGVTFSNISAIDYNGWYPDKGFDVEGLRIDDSKRVNVVGCRFLDIPSNGYQGSPYCIYLRGSFTSDTVIGGSEADSNAFGVHKGYNVYNSSTADVDATYNFWPSDDPDVRIYDQLDYSSCGRVNSANYLADAAPQITTDKLEVAYNGAEYVYNIAATDADGDLLEFSARPPEGFTFTDHGDGTATLSGVPSNDDIGRELWASVTVTSGPTQKSDTQYLNILVAVNTSIASRPVGSVVAGQAYSYQVTAVQRAPFGALHYAMTNGPEWLNFDADSATFSGTPTADNTGAHAVEVSCTDDSGWSVSQSFSVTVLATNFPYAFWSGGLGVKDVVIKGNYAYAEAMDGLHVLDISNPSTLTEVAFLGGAGGDNVAVDDDHVAVSSGNVFGIIDISDIEHPQLLKAYSLGGNILQLRYDDDKIYIITEGNGFYIINVETPSAATLYFGGIIGSDGSNYSRLDDLDVEGELLGLVHGFDEFSMLELVQLWNVSDPAHPSLVEGEGVPPTDRTSCYPRIDIDGDSVHVTKWGTYFRYGSGTSTSLEGHTTPVELSAVGDLVYLGSTDGGLDVLQAGEIVYSYPAVDYELNAIAANAHVVLLASENGIYMLPGFGASDENGDTDSDGISDSIENSSCTAFDNADTDGDGIDDGIEDVNHNGLLDAGETSPCRKSGDVDGDDAANLRDVVQMLMLLSGSPVPAVVDAYGDTDGDGLLGLSDVLYIMHHLSGD